MYLSDLLQNIYSDMGQTDPIVGNFIATGGSATTFINTDWASLESPPEEDALKGRYVFVTSTTDGLSPQGKWSKISAYADATNTATITTVTDAIGAGDVLMLPKQDMFPLQEVITRVNRALVNLGNIVVPDTSLTTNVSGVYDVPLTLKNKKPRSIFYGSDSVGWLPVSNWTFEPAAAGTTGKLFLPSLPSGFGIKIFYYGVHPSVSAYNSVIYEPIHPKVATLASIIEILMWYNNRDENQGANEYYLWLLGEKKKDLAQALVENPIEKPAKAPRYFVEGISYTDPTQNPRNTGGYKK
jgi:hypothetical protein